MTAARAVRRKVGSKRPGEATSSCPVRLGTWRKRDEQSAVVVVRGEEVAGHWLRVAGARPQLELLSEAADTEEVIQDVFWTVYRKAKSFQGNSRFSTWLYRLTVNAALGKIRRRKNNKAVE